MKTDNAIQALEDMATACSGLAEVLRAGTVLDSPVMLAAAAAYTTAARASSEVFLRWTQELGRKIQAGEN
jgi:hypothetical protein